MLHSSNHGILYAMCENCDVLHKIDTDVPSPKFNLTHETPASYRSVLFSGATPPEGDWQPKAKVVLMVVAGSVVFDRRREPGCGCSADFIANLAKALTKYHVHPMSTAALGWTAFQRRERCDTSCSVHFHYNCCRLAPRVCLNFPLAGDCLPAAS